MDTVYYFSLFQTLVHIVLTLYLGTLKLRSSGPLYSIMVIGTLAVDGLAVTFGTARRGPVLSSLYQM